LSVQIKHRRDTAANIAGFTPAQGELIVDTTNNRVIAGDGSTAGGWPAAGLVDMAGGFVNKLRNGTMDVWQRGTSFTVTTAGAYTADGWIVTPTGASVSVTQGGGLHLTKAALLITGATGVTDVQISQRIESYLAAQLCGQQVTVQALINNQTGAAITPTLTVKRPSTQDGWGGTITTDISAVSLQSCPNGATTQIAYTFPANSACYQGLQISFDLGNNFGSSAKSASLTEFDLRITPWAATGICNAPPAVEYRNIAIETVLCQRYYFQLNFSVGYTFMDGYNTSPSNATYQTTLPVSIRATPTFSMIGSFSFSSNLSGVFVAGSSQAMFLSATVTSTGRYYGQTTTGYTGALVANAEL
jgi:hypothetical protein